MTLEKAIIHAEEVAEENEREFHLCPYPSQECNGSQDCRCLENGSGKGCLKCAAEHRQLAEWLRKLQKIKEIYDNWNVDFGVDDHRAMNKIGEVLNGNDD